MWFPPTFFWNHHEEEEGKFRFDGNRNIRKFLKLCEKHGMYVIVRIGPFDTAKSETAGCRTGFTASLLRCEAAMKASSPAPGTLRKLAEQFEGLYFKDGGPIIGTQIENDICTPLLPGR